VPSAIPIAGIFILSHYNLDHCAVEADRLGPDTPKTQNDYYALVDQGEGVNSSVAVTSYVAGPGLEYLYFHVAGKVEASTKPLDMRPAN